MPGRDFSRQIPDPAQKKLKLEQTLRPEVVRRKPWRHFHLASVGGAKQNVVRKGRDPFMSSSAFIKPGGPRKEKKL
jgi:hypothetical protein